MSLFLPWFHVECVCDILHTDWFLQATQMFKETHIKTQGYTVHNTPISNNVPQKFRELGFFHLAFSWKVEIVTNL